MKGITTMTNENMNYEEMTPDYDYECDYEETFEPKPITFKCHITNGFDYIDFETTDITEATSYSESLKVHLQGLQQYITKPQTQQPTTPPAPQTPPPVQRYTPRQNVAPVANAVSPKQRSILKQNGYDDNSINILTKQQAVQIIKEIFSN